MPDLKVLSKPRCPKCKGSEVTRLGYRKDRGGSEYQCLDRDCTSEAFLVPTMRLSITKKTQIR